MGAVTNEFFEQPQDFAPTRHLASEPYGAVPGVMAVERLIAQTENVAVYLGWLAAYPNGFAFEIRTTGSADAEGRYRDLAPMPHMRADRKRRPPPPEVCRVGLLYPGGQQITNLGWSSGVFSGEAEPALSEGGGSAGGVKTRMEFWAQPLPPAGGTFALIYEWPALEIPVSTLQFDADDLLAASARARVLFPYGDARGLP